MELRATRGWRYSPVCALLTLLALSACGGGAEGRDTYTLYRTGHKHPAHRIHIASFDSEMGEEYNEKNCALAEHLFESQPGVTTKFWCERGRYHR